MGIREKIELILKVEDQASQAVKQSEETVKKFGDTAKQANEKATKASQLTQKQMESLSHHISGVVKSTNKIGEGKTKFDQYTKSVNQSQVAFKRLDDETQDMLRYLSQMSDKGRETFLGMSTKAQEAVSKFNEMKNATTGWNNTLDITKTKMQLLGNDTDSLKGKLQVVGNSIQTYLGDKWDYVKSKALPVGDLIKSKLSSAINYVKNSVQSLADKFSGLGGVISSIFGGIGLSQVYNMTLGMSLAREKVKGLMYALYGAGDATDALWKKMDTDTTNSLVALDNLAQAMNVVKLSTGATTEQMLALEPVLLEIGEKSILMGKSGEEAMLLMQAAGKGLNGEFEMLRENFGITKEQLIELGWSGASDDIDGYTEALRQAVEASGDVSSMMDTTSGKLVTLEKNWRIAGRTLGDQLLPYMDQVLDYLIELSGPTEDGSMNMAQYAIGAMALASGFATIAPSIAPVLQVLSQVWRSASTAYDWIGKLYNKIPDVDGSKLEWLKSKFSSIKGAISSAYGSLGKFLGKLSGSGDGGLLSKLKNGFMKVKDAIFSTDGKLLKFLGNIKIYVVWQRIVNALTTIWNALLDMNPIMIVVIAIIALIAVLTYLYNTNESVRQAIDWLWQQLQIFAGWIIDGLVSAWNWLCQAIQGVMDYIFGFLGIFGGGEFDIVKAILDYLTLCWNVMMIPIQLIINYIQWLIGVYAQLYNVLQPIGAYILGLLAPAFESLKTIIMTVINSIGNVIKVFQDFLNGQANIGDVVMAILSAVWDIWSTFMTNLVNIWQTIINTIITLIIDFVTNMPIWSAQAGMWFLQGLWQWIQQVPPMILNFLVQAAMNINTTMLRWVSEGRAKAIAFVMGIINYIRTLPQKAWTWLVATLNNIIQAGQQWISNAKSKASEVVSGVISYISQLPEKVYQEFMNIGDKILQAGSDLVNKAIQVGKNIVDGLLGAMGIHSPGTIQTKVVEEFTNMVGGIADKIKPAFETAESMGRAIVDGFGNPKLETDTTNMLPNEDALKTSIGVQAELTHPSDMPTATMNTSGVNTSNTDVIGSFDNLADMTGNALQSMVDKDKLAYQTIQTNDSNTLSIISTDLQQKMGMMTNSVRSNMDNIVSKNKSGMNTVKNTTSTQLNAMVTKTKSANEKMIKSWGIMKDGIIDAADTIRSDSTKHFDKLSKTIGTFYGKLKNPSRWGAGGPNGPRRGKSTRGFSKITNAIKSANLPTYLTLGQIRSNPLIDSGSFGDYVIRDPKSNRFSVSDLIKYGILSMGKGAGDYSSIPSPNVKLIKDTSKEYDMKGPMVGKFSTNQKFKVKDFLTGVPKFSFDDFRRLAEDVYSQTRYEFYYDNDHHGNWINAFNAGSMNCLHGAQSLIALAKTFGFSGSLVHGHWNEYGHYFANIAGHKMDVTGWQQRRTWTPSASAGPTPKGYGFNDLIEAIKSLLDDDPKPGSSSNSSAEVSGSLTLIHEFKDVPEHISEEELAKMVEDSATNENFIKKLVRNIKFQDWDAKEKLRLERKNNRVRGV